MGDDLQELFDAIVNRDGDGLVTELLYLGIRHFIITFVSVSSLSFCDRTPIDIFLDQFGNLKGEVRVK